MADPQDWRAVLDGRRQWAIVQGDCLTGMAAMPAHSVDSIVTDPPYGLGLMGKDWDHGIPGPAFWAEALRVAKPGAHLLAFGGTRTFHRLTCAIEDAGWEIRDCIMWVYGSGFPKSHDVSKAIDKAAGAEREVIGPRPGIHSRGEHKLHAGWRRPWMDDPAAVDRSMALTAPATDAAREWAGWGTALKPAWEPIIVARKPLAGTVAQNVLAHGVGGLNIDGCRVETGDTYHYARKGGNGGSVPWAGLNVDVPADSHPAGRWPANLVLDEEAGAILDAQSGRLASGDTYRRAVDAAGEWLHKKRGGSIQLGYGATSGASRFFYCAKASRADRGDGNRHPTVKPATLMRYLCRLVTPPGGIVLDPFTGSGSTGKAAIIEGFRFVGFEQSAEYAEIAAARVGDAKPDTRQLTMPLMAVAHG